MFMHIIVIILMTFKLTAIVYKKAPAAQCVISWKTPANWFVLRKLQRGEPCGCPKLAKYSEVTALNYSIYQAICGRLHGDVKAAESSKVTKTASNYQNGEFVVSISCDKGMASIRKCLTTTAHVLSSMSRLYSLYAANMVLLNGRQSRDDFRLAYNELVAGLSTINAVVIGKVSSLDSDKIAAIVKSANDKYEAPKKEAIAKSAPQSLLSDAETLGESEYPTFTPKAKSAATIATVHLAYDMTNHSAIKDCCLIVYNEKAKFDNDKAKEKAKMLLAKHAKSGADMRALLAFHMATSSTANATDLIAFFKSDATVADVVAFNLTAK